MTASIHAFGESDHTRVDEHGKQNQITITYAPWHPQPCYTAFKTGSLLSRNDEFPSGLIIVDERGKPSLWKS